MILLIVDTQKLITNEKLYKFNEFVSNVETLIKTARENNLEVVYIRHDDGIDSELTKGQAGFEVYDKFKPMETDKIFDKVVNSAFKCTGLLEYLKSKSVKDIIVAGLQSDYCIDATVKCGFEHGFNIIVPGYCNSTLDNSFMTKEESYNYYNNFIWKDRYAKCITLEDTLDIIIKN